MLSFVLFLPRKQKGLPDSGPVVFGERSRNRAAPFAKAAFWLAGPSPAPVTRLLPPSDQDSGQTCLFAASSPAAPRCSFFGLYGFLYRMPQDFIFRSRAIARDLNAL